MKLTQAFSVRTGDIITFTGAGGKTTAMFRLAAELVEMGFRVLTTTTTRLALHETEQAPLRLSCESMPEGLSELLSEHRHIFLYHHPEGEKAVGFTPDWIEENLVSHHIAEILLIEADGSRQLPFKGAYDHEPPIPPSTSLLVPVVGLSIIGSPLDSEHVYGVENLVRLLGLKPGEEVTPQVIAASLLHPHLGMKNLPDKACFIPLLTQVTGDNLDKAREIARSALTDLHVSAVAIASIQLPDPVREVRSRIGAVVLAAGRSTRMETPKLLLDWGDTTIIRHVCRQIAQTNVYQIIVITGEWHEKVSHQIRDIATSIVYNSRYAEGEMLSSLKAGLSALWGVCEACMIVLGDQPAIQAEVADDLLTRFAESRGHIVAPSYNNRRGHPVIISQTCWQELMDLPQDAAPRDMIRQHEQDVYHHVVDTSSVIMDIDTPEDYHEALKNFRDQ